MTVFDIFSKRKRRIERAGEPDVYQYDSLPQAFRVQVIHIWKTALGDFVEYSGLEGRPLWKYVNETLSREYGVFSLGEDHEDDLVQCQKFLLKASTEQALDIIEFTAVLIDSYMRGVGDSQRRSQEITQSAEDALEELNLRFREHGIGFQYESGRLIRVSSQYVHTEIVRPTLALLADKRFKGANQEFLSAHKHYRDGHFKEAIVDALKAFESTLKIICDGRKWTYAPTATAKDLLQIVIDQGLVPSYLTSHFAALRSTLEAGLPTVRNKTSGHGQGAQAIVVPEYLAAYALHLAATNILLLVRADQA